MKEKIINLLEESKECKEKCKVLASSIEEASEMIIKCFKDGGKVILFGNGGSAAQAQHIAAEFVNKFNFDRNALPAISLTTDTSNLTAIGNDSGYEHVFGRQIEALANEGDVVIAFTTSDVSDNHSANIKKGIEAAKKKNCKTIGMFSEKSMEASKITNIPICVPSKSTPRIQEAHITILHIICDIVEERIFKVKKALILAGGRGERLIPLTNEIPKPMVKICGKPVLEWQLEALKNGGIEEAVICGHYKFDAIKDYFGNEWNGIKMVYVYEKEPLGTGGAIKNAEEHFEDEDFVVFNGDIMTNIDLRDAINFHKKTRSICTLIMRNTDHPHDSNVLELDDEGRVVKCIGKGQTEVRTGHTGFFIFNKKMFDFIPKENNNIEKDVIFNIYKDQNIRGFVTDQYTRDMGTFDRLQKIEKEIMDGVIS